ncbi:ATP-binding protein [Cryptosporangium japonicum]|uniref:Histidine kinase/HSP90-like ATPase domain-containing protein n=1 Tax=Cryptosporangium japonicum TaxID=80872 RepID=A0ABP3D4A1_9ACTN
MGIRRDDTTGDTLMSTSNARFDLPPQPTSPEIARRLTGALLEAWGAPAERRDDVVMLISEVVSNAVEHVGGEASFELTLVHSGDWLRVGLTDGSSIPPMVRELDRRAVRGRGMQLVAAIADRWGVEQHHGGKTVWFTIRLDPHA